MLFPSLKGYRDKSDMYYTNMERVVSNILILFKSYGIQLYSYTTDEVGVCINRPQELGWIQPLLPEDEFFARKNCRNMDHGIRIAKQFPEIAGNVRKKYPLVEGMTQEERFELVCKRNLYFIREINKQMKCIIHIVSKSSMEYNIKPTPDDGKLFVLINNGNFQIQTFMNGEEIEPSIILGFPFANMPVHTWRSYDVRYK